MKTNLKDLKKNFRHQNRKSVMRKFLAFTLITVMLIGVIPSANAYRVDRDPDCPDFSEVVWEATGGADEGFTGTVTYVDREDADGKCYQMGGTTYLQQLIKNFTEEEQSREYFKDNVMMYSVDICPKQTDHALIMALNNYPLLMLNGKGNLSFVNQAGWPGAEYVGDVSMNYEANKWYNIKLLIDGNLKRIWVYVNDEFIGVDSHKSAGFMNKALDPSLTMEQLLFNTHTEMTFKNGVQTQSDGSGIFLIDNMRLGYPKLTDVSLEVKTDEMGNMLTKGDTPIHLDVINNEDTDKTFTLEYEIRDSENYSHGKDTQTVSAKAGEKQRVTINHKIDKCGFYYIKAKISDKDGVVDSVKTRFSVIAKTKQNPKIGFSVHPKTHGHGTMDEITKLTVKLGGGVSREDYSWSSYYDGKGTTTGQTQGQIKALESTKQYNQLLWDNNIEPLMILGQGSSTHGGYNFVPTLEDIKNTDVLISWANYCRNLAKDLGGGDKAIYEVVNEWLVQEKKTNSTPEAYAELLKVTSKALREGNPDCVIVGLCGALSGEESWWDERVLAALGDNPGQYMDAISVHPYHVWGDLYPEQSKLEDIEKYRGYLKKYGIEDIPIYGTEFGCTTVNEVTDIDCMLQADFLLREFIMLDDFLDKEYFYTITRKRDATGREVGFGITKPPTKSEIIYEAYPGALTYAMYNSLMTGATNESHKIFEFGNDDIKDDLYAFDFKLEDGKDCLAMWNVDGDTVQSVKVGAETVTVYDGYGNKKTVNAVDGYITLKFGSMPIFVVANELSEPELRETPLFTYDNKVTTMLNNSGEIKLSNATDKDLTVETDASVNISATEESCTSIGAGLSDTIVFKTGYDREKTPEYEFDEEIPSYDGMRIVIKDGNKVVFDENVKVVYEDSLETKLSIVPYKNGIWQALLSVRNTNRATSNDADVSIENNGNIVYSKEAESIAPGQKKIYRFIVPEELVGDSLKLTAKVEAKDGQQFEKTVDNKLTIICRADKMPTIDGKMEPGEWTTFSGPFKMKGSEFAQKLAGWKGNDDLSGEIYLMYDDKYLYMAAKITDNVHCGYDEQDRIWAADSIQFAVTDAQVGDARITEMGMGLMDNGPQYKRYLSQHSAEDGFDMDKYYEEPEFNATLNGNVTTYEFKMSWKDLFRYDYVPTENLIFSILVNDNDGSGRRGWMEYGSGIGIVKDAMQFLSIPLMK